jgi:hypothetical protein
VDGRVTEIGGKEGEKEIVHLVSGFVARGGKGEWSASKEDTKRRGKMRYFFSISCNDDDIKTVTYLCLTKDLRDEAVLKVEEWLSTNPEIFAAATASGVGVGMGVSGRASATKEAALDPAATSARPASSVESVGESLGERLKLGGTGPEILAAGASGVSASATKEAPLDPAEASAAPASSSSGMGTMYPRVRRTLWRRVTRRRLLSRRSRREGLLRSSIHPAEGHPR